MIAIASLLAVLFLSLIAVRIAAEALVLTGLSRESARFQARSAWTGTGFTTSESELVVGHPVRRRIISTLMFVRSAGLVTAASTLMLSFVTVEEQADGWVRTGILIAGLAALWLFARSHWIGVWMSRVIAWALKRYSDLDTRDYVGLLHLAGEYAVIELKVQPGGWIAGRSLAELRLPDEGVLVLGVAHANGAYIGAPRGGEVAEPGDVLLLYGRSSVLAALGRRRSDAAGDDERQSAVTEEQQVEREEQSASTRKPS